ncbi:glycosyltransferase family 2 protein [Butyrivibrio sp. YAB3001]|uniref:glycosyltransferase family 2 protein n=1 Tax=Butyrivibrio sp. YAB3001 TaxID=1520812 RepID=UPI0008F61D4F|nr:glycosyltransferase [Butyrivibrio sp. YAB3001]SFC78108.1 Glycosyltransferase involved in cell wall bisynthesis [Butyrivibrio sp. YAB3001]
MGIKNAVLKTIAYQKRNGTRAAFFAALERLRDNHNEKYDYVPLSKEVIEEQKQEYRFLAEAGNCVRFSIVVPLFNTPEKYLREMIESVLAQTYGNWELVLADASPDTSDIVLDYAQKDPRIKYYHFSKNEGISENTNRGLEKASGDYIGLLDHDDLLTPDALFEVSRVIRKSMSRNKLSRYSGCPIRLIYSDEDKFDDSKQRYYEHHAKPDFNMDYLLSNNYICHFTVMRSDIIRRLKLRKKYDGAQDFDLFMRACAEASLELPSASYQIIHIPKVLYHWRCHSNSTAANPASKTYAYEAGQKAILNLLKSYNINAEVEPLKHLGFYRINYLPDVFGGRKDVGCIGGKILGKRGRIVSGAFSKNGDVMYFGLPEGYSGGFQHKAVLQQDCQAVDIRCLSLRSDLIPLYEKIVGIKYVDTFQNFETENEDGKRKDKYDRTGNEIDSMSEEEIRRLSCKLGEEIRKFGLRIVWDPQRVKRVRV